jgi:hypothetical protein
MTLSQRNRYFKAGIAVSAVCLLGIAFHAGRFAALFPGLAAGASKRAPGLFQYIAARFTPVAPYAVMAAIIAAVAYALAASILSLFYFEKTHSPEILFLGLFAFSFVFETLRFLIPLKEIYGFSTLFLVIGARLIFFGRFFGVLSFFAASVYAAGFELQKQGTIVIAIAIATLLVCLGIPVDGLSWDANLLMISGYSAVFRLAEAGILLLAVASFFVAAWSRGSRDYIIVGIASVLISLGRDFLISGDTWLTPVPGFVMLCAGTWLTAARLHQVYLWL